MPLHSHACLGSIPVHRARLEICGEHQVGPRSCGTGQRIDHTEAVQPTSDQASFLLQLAQSCAARVLPFRPAARQVQHASALEVESVLYQQGPIGRVECYNADAVGDRYVLVYPLPCRLVVGRSRGAPPETGPGAPTLSPFASIAYQVLSPCCRFSMQGSNPQPPYYVFPSSVHGFTHGPLDLLWPSEATQNPINAR